MAAPLFTVADAQALISDPTSSLCGNFVKTLLRLPVLFYQLCQQLMNDDGTFKVTNLTGDLIFSAAPVAEDANRLLCNGQEVSKTTYADLYAVIADIYGTPAVGTNFKLPDYRCRFPAGVGNVTIDSVPLTVTLAQTGGSTADQEITLLATDIPPHQHKIGTEDDNDGQGESTTPANGYKYLKVDSAANLYVAAVPTNATVYKMSVDEQQPVADQTDVVIPHQSSPWIGCYVYIKT